MASIEFVVQLQVRHFLLELATSNWSGLNAHFNRFEVSLVSIMTVVGSKRILQQV